MTVLPGIMLMIIAGIGWAAVGAVVGAGANKKISWWVHFFQGKSCVGDGCSGCLCFCSRWYCLLLPVIIQLKAIAVSG